MCKREELVQSIGKLHEELVANVDAREEMSADDSRCPDNVYERNALIGTLVEAIKEFKLLDATPCATGQLPVVRPIVQQSSEDEGDCVWVKGFKASLRSYAWWKDGTQYVGCGVWTLEQALAGVSAEWPKEDADKKGGG